MLRAVLLTPYYFPVVGGVETHARHQARCLQREGAAVWVLTKQMGPDTPRTDQVDGIRVLRVPPQGPRRGLAKWRMIPRAVAALLRHRDDFDVIICPDYRGIGLAALAAGWLLRRPVVFQAATPGALSCANWDPSLARLGVKPRGVLARAVKWPVRSLYGKADAYACISREIEQEARSAVGGRALVRYIPHAVDLTAFGPADTSARERARDDLRLPRDAKVVAFVGRLSHEKGVLDLLEAWRLLEERGLPARTGAVLLVVGPDMPGHPLDAGAEARLLAARLPAGRVRLPGPADDVRPFLAAADAFVQPSHYEAFGISVIEAMAMRLAVIATCVGGMREYLVDGENALLVPPHDPPALATALGRLLSDDGLIHRLGAQARLTVERQFDERVVTRRWLDLLTLFASVAGVGLS